MTTIVLPVAYVASPLLPPMCARHGVPASKAIKRKFFTATPAWVILIAIFSLLIGAIVALAIRTTVECQLPACEQCTKDRRQFVLIASAAWVGTFLSLALGKWGPLLFVAGALGSLVWSFGFGNRRRVSGVVSKDKQSVTLKGVDESFAAEAWARMLATANSAAGAHPHRLPAGASFDDPAG